MIASPNCGFRQISYSDERVNHRLIFGAETPTNKLDKKGSLLSTSKSPLQAAYERSAAQPSKVKQHRELECGSIDENMAFTIEWVCVAAAAAISVAL